ncbi:hypothetical protein Agabi119p4_9915 [Agaricus bisporus var. burnettii]|uniref:Uncharacterized protein n=1 Tax=Agaricus bisporus var. burnettii TaxID=192524 RepID=A0A8H7C4B0_AGABI|nr:hypothetical protein Agabi119p4_9915 [Agaricus bisporus var. burnettii]
MSSPVPDSVASPSLDTSSELADIPSSPPFFENQQGLWDYLEANPHITHPYPSMKDVRYVEIPDSEDETTQARGSAMSEDQWQYVLRQRAIMPKNISHPTGEIRDAPHETINVVAEETAGVRKDTGVSTIAETVGAQHDTIAVENVDEAAARDPSAERGKNNGRQKRRKRNLVEVSLEEDLNEKHKRRKNLLVRVPDMGEGNFKLEIELSERGGKIGLTMGAI